MGIENSVDVIDFLEHHGIRGQKWGIRNSRKASDSPPKVTRADKKWKKGTEGTKGFITLHNAVADKMNNGILDNLNKTHNNISAKDWDQNMNPITPASKAYMKDYEKRTEKAYSQAVNEQFGTSPSGNYKATYAKGIMTISPTTAKHDSIDNVSTLSFKLTRDSSGCVISMMPMQSEAKQSVMIGEAFLEHHGTKGQKWGIRNARARISSGKKSAPQSEDSKNARKLQSRPPHSLSNEELKKLNERLNLEQNASRLNPSRISKGKKHAQTVLATVGVGVALLNTPPGKALINAGRKAVIMTTGRDFKLH